MVEVESDKGVRPTLKLSSNKATYPSRKQTWRKMGDNGYYGEDLVGCADEKLAGKPLLKKVMEKGKLIAELPAIEEISKKTGREMARLSPRVKSLSVSGHYPVKYSDKLRKLRQKLTREIKLAQGLL